MRIYHTNLSFNAFLGGLFAFVALANAQAQNQTVWLHLEKLPEGLIKIYGKDSLTQLMSQQIITKQQAFTLEQYGYQDNIRLATSVANPAYQKDFNLKLWVIDTLLQFKSMTYIKYALYEKDSLSNSFQLPLEFDETTPSKTVNVISGMTRIVMNNSISKKVNTITKNWQLPQIDSLRITQKSFYHLIIEYKGGKQIPMADKQLIWNMIQNQWNQTQAKLQHMFQQYFNLYFWQTNTTQKVKKRLLKKLPNYIKITYNLEMIPKQQSYRVTPKIELKNVSKPVYIKTRTVSRKSMNTYPYKTLGSIAWAYLTMKELFEL